MALRNLRAPYYGWVIVAATSAALLFGAGIRVVPGAFLLDMVSDTGWSRASLSLAAGIGLLVYGFTGPAAGSLMVRIGSRRVATIALLVTAVALGLSSLVEEEWQLTLVFGLLSGIGTGMIASVLGAAVASRWFIRYRGLVVGIFGAASSAGQLLFYPLLSAMVEGSGWRSSALMLAAAAALLAIPVALLTFAIAQMGVHLVFFLHLTSGPDNTNNIMALAFGVLIVFLLFGGSVWIMHHMNTNMMMPAEGGAPMPMQHQGGGHH